MPICPHCRHLTAIGEFCEHCHGVLMHSASKGYKRALQKAAQNQTRGEHLRQELRKKRRTVVLKETRRVAWKNSYLFFIGLGLFVIIYACRYYASPVNALRLSGTRFSLAMTGSKPAMYLVGTQTEIQLWANPTQHSDIPLESLQSSETGTLTVSGSEAADMTALFKIQPGEWTTTLQHQQTAQTHALSAADPSLQPASIQIDLQGTVLNQKVVDDARIGRAAKLLFPLLPKGSLWPNAHWSENVAWTESVGGWVLHFEGTLYWTLAHVEACEENGCTRLTYAIEAQPRLLKAPAWVRLQKPFSLTVIQPITGSGQAVYAPKEKTLIAQSLTYEGGVQIPVRQLEETPWEERPGDAKMMGDGTLRLHISGRWDARKS